MKVFKSIGYFALVFHLGFGETLALAEPSRPNNVSPRLAVQVFEGEPVPKSFEALINLIKEKLEKIYSPSEVVVELEEFDGRSLDQDYDSITWPRRVVSFQVKTEGGSTSGSTSFRFVPIFMGFAPKRERLEIISLIPGKGYEFLIIDHFGPKQIGQKMVVSQKQDELCLSCHQSRAPIFSKFPWNESRGRNHQGIFEDEKVRQLDPNNLTVQMQKIKPEGKEPGLSESDLYRLKILPPKVLEGLANPPDDKTLAEFAEDGRQSFNQPFEFDANVRAANQGAQMAKALTTICGKEIHCKQLALGLLVAGFNLRSGHEDLNQLQSEFNVFVQKNWDDQTDFSYPSSVLPDRNLDKNSDGVVPWIIPQDPKNGAAIMGRIYDESQASSSLTLQENGQILNLPGYRTKLKSEDGTILHHPGDPQTKRPRVSYFQKPESFEPNVVTGESDNIDEFGNKPVLRNFWSPFFDLGLVYGFGITPNQLASIPSQRLVDLGQKLSTDKEVENLLAAPQVDSERLTKRILEMSGDVSKTPSKHKSMGDLLLQSYPGFFTEKKRNSSTAEQKAIDLLGVPERQRIIKNLSTQFCSACHGPQSEVKLPLESPSHLANYISSKGQTPFERIRNGEMPPRIYKDTLRQFYAKEHPDLENDLKKLADLLEKERSSKPSSK